MEGAVQGVGFRPYVYRLAADEGLAGWVLNGTEGVRLEVEGASSAVERFLARLVAAPPPRAVIRALRHADLPPAGFAGFRIVASDAGGTKSAAVLPDLATCDACRDELFDPRDRRFRYPFLNCTDCGPRFTIVRALPYDRPNTTMAGFALCDACRAEYEEPRDRRFHAQPTACPACGPRLALWEGDGTVLAAGEEALQGAIAAIRGGKVVAVKGLGGFHLVCDARDEGAVARLRAGKVRREKPFALMVRDVAAARALCAVSESEAALLASPEAPILLLARHGGCGGGAEDGDRSAVAPSVAPNVAPESPRLGLMLAATPLHHLLLEPFATPLVATSGNRSDEPIAIDEREALERLRGLAELFLVHDRPIERHADDSLAWVFRGEAAVLRRSRGFAPLPVPVAGPLPPLLGVGAHLKGAVALGFGSQVFVSQHVGDLETPEALGAFERVIADLLRLYEAEPVAIAHDLHPSYLSTQWARAAAGGEGAFAVPPVLRRAAAEGRLRLVAVQHHHAHLASCLSENGFEGSALGVAWDGTGHGTDGTVWGGEFLAGSADSVRRVAHLRPFRLPGGEAAVREPRRAALALLHEAGIGGAAGAAADPLFTEAERALLGTLLARGLNSPVTTSAGRLFDGVAALLGLHPKADHEGQAATALEALVDPDEKGSYPFPLRPGPPGSPSTLDWAPLLAALLDDGARGVRREVRAARFHGALVEGIVAAARASGEAAVALTGGCFQNRVLLEKAVSRLEEEGFRVLVHHRVPPNDGGIALGQVAVAAAMLRSSGAG